MIPKKIKYQDSDDEVESDEGEGEADSLGGPV
jgi:hypothetical protein